MPKKSTPSNRILTTVLYCYIEPHIASFAKRKGMAEFGSTSAYINYLIAKEAKDTKSVDRMYALAEQVFGDRKEI